MSRLPPLALIVLAAAACGWGEGVSALEAEQVRGAAVTVHIVDSPETVGAFQPAYVRVPAGAEVGFVNAGGNYHTVTFFSGPSVPSSRGIAPGGRFTVRLARPGGYFYRCTYHQGMVGEIEVVAAATPAPSPSISPPTP